MKSKLWSGGMGAAAGGGGLGKLPALEGRAAALRIEPVGVETGEVLGILPLVLGVGVETGELLGILPLPLRVGVETGKLPAFYVRETALVTARNG